MWPEGSLLRQGKKQMLNAISQAVRNMLDKLRERLVSRVVWSADPDRNLGSGPVPKWALVLIWGRDHYREIHRYYPINRWSDALAVARTEAATLGPCMLTVGKFSEGRRRITFHCLDLKPDSPSVKALFWLPEAAVIERVIPANALATVERGGLRYFLSNGESQIAGGVIQTAERFALASGIRGGWQAATFDDTAIREMLREGLGRLDGGVWSTALSPDLERWFVAIRRPLMLGLLAFVVAYMILATLYVAAALALRESAVTEVAETVAPLLDAQKRVERLRRERALLLELQQGRKLVLPLWGGLDGVWQSGGVVQALTWNEKSASIRGRATDATAVLAALRQVPQIKGARFSAAVRQESGRQDFSIQFEIDPSVPLIIAPAVDDRK